MLTPQQVVRIRGAGLGKAGGGKEEGSAKADKWKKWREGEDRAGVLPSYWRHRPP